MKLNQTVTRCHAVTNDVIEIAKIISAVSRHVIAGKTSTGTAKQFEGKANDQGFFFGIGEMRGSYIREYRTGDDAAIDEAARKAAEAKATQDAMRAAMKAQRDAERAERMERAWERNTENWNARREIPTTNGTITAVDFTNERGTTETWLIHFQRVNRFNFEKGGYENVIEISVGTFNGTSFGSMSGSPMATSEEQAYKEAITSWF